MSTEHTTSLPESQHVSRRLTIVSGAFWLIGIGGVGLLGWITIARVLQLGPFAQFTPPSVPRSLVVMAFFGVSALASIALKRARLIGAWGVLTAIAAAPIALALRGRVLSFGDGLSLALMLVAVASVWRELR